MDEQIGMSAASSRPLLVATGITKAYGGVVALRGADLEVLPGEIHALLGENGAGKSTLIKILVGAIHRDGGDLLWRGEPLVMESRRDAIEKGIRVVFQHSALIEHLTVEENLVLGEEDARMGWIDRRAMARRAQEALAELDLDIDLKTPVSRLKVGERQLVEIARALSAEGKLLILDEPTASLSEGDAERLFALLRKATGRGTAVIYISHRLDEVLNLADRITILRDGASVGTVSRGEKSKSELVSMMVGRYVPDRVEDLAPPGGDVVLRVEGLCTATGLTDIDFELHEGEILGVYGLLGSGRTELARALMAADPISGGSIQLGWTDRPLRSVSDACDAGLGMVPEDRLTEGVFPVLSVRENLTVAAGSRVSRGGWVDTKRERRLAEEAKSQLSIVAPSVEARISTLSGGNQQKAVMGRWFLSPRRVLVLDDPTVGVDVGARHEIHRLIAQLASEGTSIVLTSSDLDELVALCHRIMVLRNKQVAGFVDGNDLDKSECLHLALGA